MHSTTDLLLRYMYPGDIPDVIHIDRLSFDPPWPMSSYRFEVTESQVSFMAVLEKEEEQPIGGIRRLLNRLRGDEDDEQTEPRGKIVGYGGLWKIAEEAHISTIATHPDYRGHSYGEILLAGMIRRAIDLNADYIVLEVRVSNHPAQSLYHKYNFEITITKKEYYRSDKEDAYEMRLTLSPENIAYFNTQYDELRNRVQFENAYSQTDHPRQRRG